MKKLILLLLALILLVSPVLAWEWDNTKSYDTVTKTATITNALGMGSTIAKITLLSEEHRVVLGNDYVAELLIDNYDTYSDWLNNMDFYHKESFFEDTLTEKITGQFSYKYFDDKYEQQIPTAKTTCTSNLTKDCTTTTTYETLKGRWVTLDEKQPLPKGTWKVRLYFNRGLTKDEIIEWIPTFYGKEITEWVDFGSATIRASQWESDNDYNCGTSRWRVCQTFNTSTSYVLNGATIGMGRFGALLMDFFITYADVNDKPTTNVTVENDVDVTSLPTGETRKNFNVSFSGSPTIVAGTKYALCMSPKDISGTHGVYVFADNTILNYTKGMWQDNENAGDSSRDMAFVLWGTDPVSANVTNIAPADKSYYSTTNIITYYNVTIPSGTINNCSLYLNGILNETDTTITVNTSQNFNKNYADGSYLWKVGCYNDNFVQVNGTQWNFTIDTISPIVNLIAPLNNSMSVVNPVYLYYNASDTNDISNCSLTINNLFNTSYSPIANKTKQSFEITFETGTHNWRVQCEDIAGNKANSTLFNFTLNNKPTTPTTTSPVNNSILPLAQTILTCSGSVDADGDVIKYEFYNRTTFPPTFLMQNTTSTVITYITQEYISQYWNCRANDGYETSDYVGSQNITFFDFTQQCGVTNATANLAVNITFADETNLSGIRDVTYTATAYGWGTDSGLNKTVTANSAIISNFTYCYTPKYTNLTGLISATYSKTGYGTKHYTGTIPLNTTTANITLYLLTTSSGQYVTFQVVNGANQVIQGVNVKAEKQISGTWTEVASGSTDASGAIQMFLNPDSPHIFTFSKTGYDNLVTTLTPSQTSYTIAMGKAIEQNTDDYTQGISYFITPPSGSILTNHTYYNFSFKITSNYWTLTNAGFDLRNQTASLGYYTCTGASGCTASINSSTGNQTKLFMDYFWVIAGNYTNGTASWSVAENSIGSGSIKLFFVDLELLGSGFSNDTNWKFTKIIMVFLIIFVITGVTCYYSGIYSPTAILGMLFGLTAFFNVAVDFMPHITETIPQLPTILMGMLFVGYLLYEWGR